MTLAESKIALALTGDCRLVVPARLHVRLSTLEREELAETLQIVAAQIISLPDVQTWWSELPQFAAALDAEEFNKNESSAALLVEPFAKACYRIREKCMSLRLTPCGRELLLVALLASR